ncbi:MAG: UbiA family prenyltransferase [Planctomycetes bacterium]|nr:UbiA family prenyltransferase [Planctomycetota bacterium]
MGNRRSGRAILELVRLPLIPSALGDPLAGAFLASASPPAAATAAAMAAGALLYAAGMVTNDLADVRKDRLRHPARPLPSGRIRPRAAWMLGILLATAALGTAFAAGPRAFAVACALAGAIALYNGGAKRAGLAGCAIMGSCRGLNLLLGARAAGGEAWIPAAILTAYVAAVTAASLGEDRSFHPRRFAATAPLWVLFPAALAVQAASPVRGLAAAAPLAIWLGVALGRTRRGSARGDHPLEGFTRRALEGIYLVDGGLLIAAARTPVAIATAALWALGRCLAAACATSPSSPERGPRPSSPAPPARPPAPPWQAPAPSSPSAGPDGSCR